MITPKLREQLIDLAEENEDYGEMKVQPVDILELIATYDWLLENRKSLWDLVGVLKAERNTSNADRDRWRLRALRAEKIKDSDTTKTGQYLRRHGW